MGKFIINGKRKLRGEASLQGSKNSALPIMAAALLTEGENVFLNVPELTDTDAAMRILRCLGCRARREGCAVLIDSDPMSCTEVPDSLMREMRGSIIFLGAMLSRCGCARLSLPGGCELGARPIDLHLKALRAMGAEITERGGVLECSAGEGLSGAKIALSFPSVGATENIILAAVLAEGKTTLTNAAREPEIVDLCDFLNKAGAEIYGAGEGTLVIEGVRSLRAVKHTIIPDRIVAATLLSAAAVTGSQFVIRGAVPSHLGAVIPVFEEAGCKIDTKDGDIFIAAPERLSAMSTLRTMPYPGFPTDAQAPLMAAASVCDGTTVFSENIFENRYKHAEGLRRLGADISTEGRVAVVKGVKSLYGAELEAHDLRGAAALLTAALSAEGRSELSGIRYLERGYERFEQVLSDLGADVIKV